MLSQVRVIAVLGLDRNSSSPHTQQKTGIIFAQKREKPARSIDKEEVLFLVSERSGKTSRGEVVFVNGKPRSTSLWERVDHDLQEIEQVFWDFITSHDLDW